MLNLPSILRLAEYLPSKHCLYKKRLERILGFVQESGFIKKFRVFSFR